MLTLTGAALLELLAITAAHRLTEPECLAVLRGLAGDVLVQAVTDALAARAAQGTPAATAGD